MTGLAGNSEFCFPWTSMFQHWWSRGNKSHCLVSNYPLNSSKTSNRVGSLTFWVRLGLTILKWTWAGSLLHRHRRTRRLEDVLSPSLLLCVVGSCLLLMGGQPSPLKVLTWYFSQMTHFVLYQHQPSSKLSFLPLSCLWLQKGLGCSLEILRRSCLICAFWRVIA